MAAQEHVRVDGRGLARPLEPGSDSQLSDLVRARIAVQVAIDILEPLYERSGFAQVRLAVRALQDGIREEEDE